MRRNINIYVRKIITQAKAVSYYLRNLGTAEKNAVLRGMADSLLKQKEYILSENAFDVKLAIKNKKSKAFIDRLTLNENRLIEMSRSLKEIADFNDPIDEVIKEWNRPNGLRIKKVRCPIGVILVIYEARPNVTSDCIGLLFKSNNAAILRGGKDAVCSNIAIAKVLNKTVVEHAMPYPPFFIVEKTDHETIIELLRKNDYIDLVIPRGGEKLIRMVMEKSRIPVIKHYKGVCHIFVDDSADLVKALEICVNSKIQRPGVCNAVEKILVHEKIAREFLPRLKDEFDKHNVEIRADEKVREIIPKVKKAVVQDWYQEYLDLIVTIKIVGNVAEAIDHINNYGSHHTDCILSRCSANSSRFVKEVDSACCFVNISTRFSDGMQFGLGAEIGISTDKLHARGPMGVEDLTTYKYVVEGNGQIRE